MFKIIKHLHLVNKHRFMVFRLCCKCGLFWRGLVHDLSKYSPTEFCESVKYYEGNRSPLSLARETKGYSAGWLHHKGRNKHHIEYWYDQENKVQVNMPYKYAVECICDKVAAAKCYNRKNYNPEKVLNHWNTMGSLPPMNPKTKQFFIKVFEDLVNLGEKAVLNKKYLKKTYKQIIG